MRIVLGLDGRYAAQVGVVLTSLRAHHPGAIEVHLLCSEVAPADLDRLRSLGARIHPVDERRWTGLPSYPEITAATYHRLLIGDLLPPDVDKVLYLDGDLVVDGDLSPLWEVDVSDVVAAAGDDPNSQRERYGALGLAEDHLYFNSGVLLVNLDAWRRERVAERALDFLHERGAAARLLDQDALNAVMQGRVRRLGARWNYMPWLQGSRRHADYPEIAAGRLKPAIIHYAGTRKPWQDKGPADAYSRLYWRHWWKSPWASP